MLELYQKPLSEIPIKEISALRQKPFVDKVDQILAITQADDYDPAEPPQAQVQLESEIDELVMDLYELTDGEKDLVRDS